jgi:hypothetical protein
VKVDRVERFAHVEGDSDCPSCWFLVVESGCYYRVYAWSAEFVECLGLKPCCVGMLGRFGVI